MFSGTYTAIVTPFENGRIDERAFERLVDSQISGGITGLVPVGTTGESPTLDHSEHAQVIELAIKFSKKRVPIIAGTGSNSTAEAISLTRDAERLGADAALLVAPYYNKPSQEGLFHHFRRIANSTSLPLVLYSIPGRCGIEIGVETVARLVAECPTVVAIKEAGGSVERVSQLRSVLPEKFAILSGDDSLTLPFMSVGAVGVISVASNIIPKEVGEMVSAALTNDFPRARELHFKYYPLFKDLFIEPNPAPIKTALGLQGVIQPELRLPLCGMAEATQRRLEETLRALSLIR